MPGEGDVLAATLGQATLDHAYRLWLQRDGRGDLRTIVERSFDLVKHLAERPVSKLDDCSLSRRTTGGAGGAKCAPDNRV